MKPSSRRARTVAEGRAGGRGHQTETLQGQSRLISSSCTPPSKRLTLLKTIHAEVHCTYRNTETRFPSLWEILPILEEILNRDYKSSCLKELQHTIISSEVRINSTGNKLAVMLLWQQLGGVNADSVECGISGKCENLPCKREVAALNQTKEWKAVMLYVRRRLEIRTDSDRLLMPHLLSLQSAKASPFL